MSDCLDDNALAAFAERRLPAEALAEIEAHIDLCDDCRRLLATWSALYTAPGTPLAVSGDALSEEATESPLERGTAVGRYILLDPIGAGGMGVVYAAYDPELDRKIALKLLRAEFGVHSGRAPLLQAQLFREARTLAQLSHPNVITVYDVGTFSGRVFIAMEFVAGTTLRQWLLSQPHPVSEVLRVFREAGTGLFAAHTAGLVHRDFKPDNVLIGQDGRVRVTDFGLARLVNRERQEQGLGDGPCAQWVGKPQTVSLLLSDTGVLAGTPAYMAPEQHLRASTDARTDQFSFCVALYEALAGARPFAGDGGQKELLARMREEAPQAALSARIPARLRSAILRGLRYLPDARHPTMESLLVALRPERSRRRLWRFGASAAVLAMLMVAPIRSYLQTRQLCRGAERKLAGVWDPAVKQRIHQAFLHTGLPYVPDAWRAVERALDSYARAWVAVHTETCEATRVRGEQSDELLSLRMVCLEQRLDEIRALSTLLSQADRPMLDKAVQASQALTDLARCTRNEALLARVRPPAEPAEQQRIASVRSSLARATALTELGNYPAAQALASELVPIASAIGYRPLESAVLYLVGDLKELAGESTSARDALLRAAWAAEAGRDEEADVRASIRLMDVERKLARFEEARLFGDHSAALLERLGNGELEAMHQHSLALVDQAIGRYDAAYAREQRALAMREKQFGPDDVLAAAWRMDLSGWYWRKGQFPQAQTELERVLPVIERVYGRFHPLFATALTNHGLLLKSQGRLDEAERECARALALRENSLGADHPSLAITLDHIGALAQQRRHLDDALRSYRRGLAIREKHLDPAHPSIATSLDNVTLVLLLRSQYEEALPLAQRALAIRERALGPLHADVAMSLHILGGVLRGQGKYSEALAGQRRALSIWEKALDPEHPNVADTLIEIGVILDNLGQHPAAIEPFHRALAIREKKFGPYHPKVASALQSLGRVLLSLHRLDDACGAYARARNIDEQNLGAQHNHVALDLTGLGRCELASQRAAQALPLLTRAVQILESDAEKDYGALGEARFALAQTLWRLGRSMQARRLALLSQEAYQQTAQEQPQFTRELATVTLWLRRHRVTAAVRQ